MTTINTSFKIGSYYIDAKATFNGRSLNTVVAVDGTVVERASSNAADYYTTSGLAGAALEAYDRKWLKDYATNAVMSVLLSLIEERGA